jgi:hypothetical protein
MNDADGVWLCRMVFSKVVKWIRAIEFVASQKSFGGGEGVTTRTTGTSASWPTSDLVLARTAILVMGRDTHETVGQVDSRREAVADREGPYRDGVIHYLRDDRIRGVLLRTSEGRSTPPDG